MFACYKNAEICYVHLADLEPNSLAIAVCRWFTRGWTLQEMLASRRLEFYDTTWNVNGSKLDLIYSILSTTGISREFLGGIRPVSDSSLARRMSSSASRQPTRVEDMAYCLLGIFNVHMPLIYGKGLH